MPAEPVISTSSRYDRQSASLHWAMAVLLVAQLALGWWMIGLRKSPPRELGPSRQFMASRHAGCSTYRGGGVACHARGKRLVSHVASRYKPHAAALS